MAETSGFFDAEELTDGTFDREYIAEQWANYFKLFIGNGVFINPTNQLKVVAGEGMQVIVKQGWAFINGYWYHNDSDLAITVPVNSTPSTVNSGVFVQFNSQNRTVTTILANGRTEVDRELPHYELKLAEVSVATGTTAITDSMITDTRPDEDVCGFVKGLVSVVSTDDLFQQFTDMFMTWFEEMKDQLSEDAAGHLQAEIDEITGSMVAIEECTDEEYDDLPQAEKHDGKIRIVGDQDGQTSAAVIKYDNTESGMSARNVQAAIDEIHTDLSWTLLKVFENVNEEVVIPSTAKELRFVTKATSTLISDEVLNVSDVKTSSYTTVGKEFTNPNNNYKYTLIATYANSGTNGLKLVALYTSSQYVFQNVDVYWR